jgi:ABC transport system ATP-binding/permease protein
MLELFVLNGQDVGQSARLHAGDSIGRNEGNRLRLRDRSISRRHAAVEERQGLTVLVDAGSTNGLHLNGERVAEVVLTDGLEFLAGEVELRVRLDRPVADMAQAPKAKPAQSAPAKPAPPKPPADEPVFSFGGGVAAPRGASGKGRSSDDAEIELEIEFDEEPAGAEPAANAPAEKRAPVADLRADQRAKLLAELGGKKSSLMSADLSQYPGWIQGLVALVVLSLGCGLVYLIYSLVVASRTGN